MVSQGEWIHSHFVNSNYCVSSPVLESLGNSNDCVSNPVLESLGNSNDCVSNSVLAFFKPLIDCNHNLFVKLSKLRISILELLLSLSRGF